MSRKVEKLRKVLLGRSPVLIVSHDHPDADSLAASAALEKLLRETMALEATIACDGFVGRAENRLLQKFLGRTMVALEEVDFHDYGALAMVDTQPGMANNRVPREVEVTVVIDHHPREGSHQEVAFWDVRERYGATSTILTEYLLEARLEIDTPLATALFYGITSETLGLGRESIRADEEAALRLYPLVDKKMLSRIEHAPVSPRYFRGLVESLSSAVRYGPLAVARTGQMEEPELVAEVAETLLRLEGIRWGLALGQCGSILYCSLRTVAWERGDAGRVLRQAVRGLGRAGGHGHRAGAQVPLEGRSPKELEEVTEQIVQAVRSLVPEAQGEAETLWDID